MNEFDWAWMALPLLVLNGVATVLALYGRYNAERSRRRLVALIWLLPVLGAAIALYAVMQHKPPAVRMSVSRTSRLHRGDGATVWSSTMAYRYTQERHDSGGNGSGDSGGAMGGGDGGSGDCGASGGGCH
ncbi:hypothetical protein [Pseudomonas sp. CGJS7]|uniref:hypothetical protein n=1 Tax=Pseudomonas sp. CGJS7 TaxID=3109348 RepID=UPI00300A0496